ncbi:CobW family GTP-binding protein [Vibrio salinus]|uniref:CobW family GTP-binding protein n=1 Tax=Vibrio salinus TaxID=2899784 RepID=UPI001E457670|nr:GTP-binding protein [Vibrio salinus]MCE0495960.1 GTP-binding protein [Vibrio salinus]
MPQKIPANIITGFLGVGKTTAILSLLNNKPENEKWAVLVNEFGEIGIDGAMLSGQGAVVKEVPGGCMCCAAGVPTSVAITALLRQQPDRLIIEPTGLGHPKEIIALLLSAQYSPYIDLKATITLTDPRYLSNEKYLSNQNFQDQLNCADVVIGNKVDLCTAQDIDTFNSWLTEQTPAKVFHKLVRQGQIPPEILELSRRNEEWNEEDKHHHHHAEEEPQFMLEPGKAYTRRENTGQGYYSCGWLFGAEYTFEFDALFSLFQELTAERVKAVVNTDRGCYAFNKANGVLSINELSLDGFESRIEVIDSQLMPWEELNEILVTLSGVKYT